MIEHELIKIEMGADLRQSDQGQSDRVLRGHTMMIVATILIATSFPVGAAITEGLDPLILTFLRFLLAALLFFPIVAVGFGLPLPTFRDLARYSLLSAALVGFFWAMFEALRLTSTLNTAAIFSLIPGMTAILSFTFLRERLSGTALVALLVGLVGAVWVIFRGSPSAFLSMDLGRGDLIFFAGSTSLAVYGTLVRVLHRGEPMARMTLWTLLTGTLWLLILATPRFGAVEWFAVPTTVFLGVAYLAVFTTIVTFFAVQWSTAVIGPTKVMAYSYLNPSLVLLIGLLLGTENPPLITYPGIALTVAATFVLQRSPSAR